MSTNEMTTVHSSEPMGGLLVGIVDRPAATLRAVVVRPGAWTWLAPLLILVVCLVPMAVVQAPYNVEIARQQVRLQLDQMPKEQQQQVAGQMEMFTSAPFLIATGLGMGVIMLLIGLLAQALVLYLGGLVAGGEATFGMMFRVSTWSRLPYAVSYLALTGFTLLAERTVRYPGLSALVATGNLLLDSRKPLFTLLSGIDLFWLWHLALVAIGVSAARRSRNGAAVGMALVYAALSLAVAALPTMLFRGS
jgi:hypothetical protein